MRVIKACFVAIFISLLICSSCTKPDEDIIGTWQYHWFGAEKKYSVLWRFDEDGQLLRFYESHDDLRIDTANYEINSSLRRTHLRITNTHPTVGGDPDANGTYRMDRLDNNILIITREKLITEESGGAYLRFEFNRI